MTRVGPAMLKLGMLLSCAACGSGQTGSQEQAPGPQPGYNLQGTWRWYDRFELPTGCLIRMWLDGDKWNGWIVQDFEVIQQCPRVESRYRLDLADMEGTRVSLWFRDLDGSGYSRLRLELEVVGVGKLEARTSKPPYTLERVSG